MGWECGTCSIETEHGLRFICTSLRPVFIVCANVEFLKLEFATSISQPSFSIFLTRNLGAAVEDTENREGKTDRAGRRFVHVSSNCCC